jgi:hypothetical protein
MARYETANTIINDTALEVGLVPAADPYASLDEAFIQLRGLLTSAGRELCDMHNWPLLVKNYSVTTIEGDTGDYALPSDFNRMINQTGWDQNRHLPIGGPLSPQDWTYLEGRDLSSTTIYASFRLEDGIFRIFPKPPPLPAGGATPGFQGIYVTFEYISGNWVNEAGSAPIYSGIKDRPTIGSDIILFQPIMMVKMLKMKFLSAKGFDSSGAANEFQLLFKARTGQDEGSPVLSAAGLRGFPFLNGYRNVGDTGFGQ